MLSWEMQYFSITSSFCVEQYPYIELCPILHVLISSDLFYIFGPGEA